MKNQLDEFKVHLENFAVSHKKEISSNPVFRGKFLKMCKSIGVDPLSSNKGMWADILGTGDFYYELGVSNIYVLYSVIVFL
jgi:ESCRT-II complex subunit VPS22